MAKCERFATQLGGEAEGKPWHLLSAHELVMASCGSAVRAADILELAELQRTAAADSGDAEAERQYSDACRILSATADLDRHQHPGLARLRRMVIPEHLLELP